MTYNKVPSVHYDSQQFKILVVDFCPHLIKYAFKLIEGHKNCCDIGYQLVYKIIKTFEQNCANSYNGKFMDHIVNPVAKFIGVNAITNIKP